MNFRRKEETVVNQSHKTALLLPISSSFCRFPSPLCLHSITKISRQDPQLSCIELQSWAKVSEVNERKRVRRGGKKTKTNMTEDSCTCPHCGASDPCLDAPTVHMQSHTQASIRLYMIPLFLQIQSHVTSKCSTILPGVKLTDLRVTEV